MSCDRLFIPKAFWGACDPTRAKPAEPAGLLPDPWPPQRTQWDVKAEDGAARHPPDHGAAYIFSSLSSRKFFFSFSKQVQHPPL